MSTTNTETYDKYIDRINSLGEEASKTNEKFAKELETKTKKIQDDVTLTDEEKKERILKLQEKIEKKLSEKFEKFNKELEEVTEKVNKEVDEIKNAITKRLEKIAPVVALLKLPSPTPDEIVKWLGKAKDTVIKEKIEPIPVHTKQIIEIAAKVALIAAAISSVVDALKSSSTPNIQIPSLNLDQATLDILDSVPLDEDGNVATVGFPSNPSLGDLYTDEEGNTYQWSGSEWIIINLENYLSGKGSVYLQYGTSYLFKWSAVSPDAPIGVSTYNWLTEKNTNYSSGDSWSTEVPTAPNTPGIYLWVASIDISDALVNQYTEINWLNNSSVSVKKADVTLKAEGLKTVVAKIYKWDITIPVAPSSMSTYNWDTKIITDIPVGWDDLAGISPSPGFSLWEATITIFEGEDVEETSINWLHSAIGAIGYAGTQGVSGIQGESGDSVDVIFKRSATQPTTPTDSQGVPAGWVSNISGLPSGSQTDYIWSSFGRKSSTKQNPTVILTNENISLHPINSDMFADASCDVSAFIGSAQLTYGTSGPNTFSIEYLANTNVAVTYTEDTINAPTEIYDNNAFVDVVVTLRDNLGNVHSSITRTINYSIIQDEIIPSTFDIFNIDNFFIKSYDGTFSPSYILLTTSETNIESSTYQWYKNEIPIYGATNSSYSVSTNDFSSVLSNTYKCIVNGTINNIPTQSRQDCVTLYRLDSATDKYIWEEPVRIEGELPVAYNLVCSSYVTSKNVSGSFSPSIISFSAYQTIGDGLPTNYSGRFKIYLNGSNTAAYTSSTNEYTKAYIIPDGTTSIKAELYFAGATTLKLDEASVVVVNDGANAPIFNITNSGAIFNKNDVGTISPTSILLNTSITNISSPTYQWYKNGTIISGATSSSYSVVATTDYSSVLTNTYKCVVTGTINGVTSQTREDYITIPRLDSPVNNPTVVLSNENVSFPAPVSGYTGIIFTGGECTISAYIGSTSLTYGTTGANTFSIGTIVKSGVTVTNTNATINAPTAMSADNAYVDIPVTLRDSLGNTATTITKRITYSLSRTGATGANAVTAVLSNESHSIPCDAAGTPTSYVGSGTDIYVVENQTYLDYVTSITGNGQFTVSAVGNGITVGAINDGTIPNRASTDVHSSMTGNPAIITYTITIKSLQGITTTITKIQTLSKSITGASGLSIAELSVYKRSATAPATPTGGSYNFATTTVTAPSGWSSTIPSGTDPVYVSRTVASITGSTGSDSTLTWSTPIISFQNGDVGVTGSSYRACYARIPDNPTPVAGTATTSGNTSFPISTTITSTNVTNWGLGAITWAASDTNPSSTYTLYVCDGIYSPSTGNTIWTTPYQASLKVGSLSAITANLGTVNTGLMKNANFDTAGGLKLDLDNSQLTVGDPIDGDYCNLSGGDILFYRYIDNCYGDSDNPNNRIPYKSLKRIEYGVAQNGSTTILPGYWKSTPYIIVSPYEIGVYSGGFNTTDQTLICRAINVRSRPGYVGMYIFDTEAKLVKGPGTFLIQPLTSYLSSIGSVNGGPYGVGQVKYKVTGNFTIYGPYHTLPSGVSRIVVGGTIAAATPSTYRGEYQNVYVEMTNLSTGQSTDYFMQSMTSGSQYGVPWSGSADIPTGNYNFRVKVVTYLWENFLYVGVSSISCQITGYSQLLSGSLNYIAIGE